MVYFSQHFFSDRKKKKKTHFESTAVTTFTGRVRFEWIGIDNSSLEGAMKLKHGPFCSS